VKAPADVRVYGNKIICNCHVARCGGLGANLEFVKRINACSTGEPFKSNTNAEKVVLPCDPLQL
jgi:hypothetical protein